MPEVTIGDRTVSIERFAVVKAMRVITLLSRIQKSVPAINKEMAEFTREYRASNVEELDRVQAKLRFGPRPVIGEDGEPMMRKDTDELLTMPSPIDRMTEADWERSGQTLKLQRDPKIEELIMAMFPLIFESAEEEVLKLMALVAMPNSDVIRYVKSGEIWERVEGLADELIAPAYLEEIMELAVAAAEQIEGQVMVKAKALGDRVGKLRRRFAPTTTSPEVSTTSSDTPETPRTDSASPSPSDGDGPTPTPSSDSPGTPSSASEMSLTPSA